MITNDLSRLLMRTHGVPCVFMIFHVLVVHNSRPNLSGRPRRLMIYSHCPQSSNMPFDVRNSPTRLRESPYERAYMRARERGEFNDVFTAPTYE